MRWYELLDEKLRDYLPDLPVSAEEPLSKYTSFRIGGPARRMAFPRNAEQLVLLMSFAGECGARPFVLGNGTNLLFPDEGIDRLVVNTRDMAADALALNVAFVPGDGFFPNGGNFHCLRMNYSNLPDDRIVEGVKRLAEVMKKYIK